MKRFCFTHPCSRRAGRGFFLVLLALSAVSLALSSTHLHGTVRRVRSGEPIPDAIVSLGSAGPMVRTDLQGRFTIAAPDSGPVVLVVRRLGYATTELSLRLPEGSSTPLAVALEESAFPIDPVVTTATRVETPVDRTPASVEVLTATDLRRQLSANVAEALGDLPGLVPRSYGAVGDVTTVSMRGSTASQVLVLVDGQRMNSGQTGEVDLSTLPLEGVERVEVMRGGASAQYGADAVGGVINIITAPAAPDSGIGVGVEGLTGSFGLRGAGVRTGFGTDQMRASFSYRYTTSDNTYAYEGAEGRSLTRANADMTSHAAGGTLSLAINEEGGRLRIGGQWFRQESGDAGTIGYPNAVARKLYRNLVGTIGFDQPFDAHAFSAQAYLHALRFGYTDPGAWIPLDNDSRNTAAGAELRDVARLAPWLLAGAGYALRVERFTGNALTEQHERTSHGLFLQASVEPFAGSSQAPLFLSVVPAVRWDRSTDFGGLVSPKLGLVASTGERVRWTVKGNAGRSFRLPTFNDLYWPNDGYTAGNPNVRRERSTDADAGLLVAVAELARLRAGVTWFHNDFTDLILWQSGADGMWTPQNVGAATVKGWETELSAEPVASVLQVVWQYTWLSAKSGSGSALEIGKQLPYRPEHQHRVALRATAGGIGLGVEWKALSRRYVDAANTRALAPFHVIDCSVGSSWRLGLVRLNLTLALRNLEDTRYQLQDGYPVPGREVRLMLGVADF